MDKNKKELLAKLYTIKAGLSAISIEKDKVSKQENILNNISKSIKEDESGVINMNNQINNSYSTINDYNSNEFKKEKLNHKNIFVNVIAGIGAGALLSPIILIVGSFLYGLVCAAIGADTSPSFAFMSEGGGILFLYSLIICSFLGSIVGLIYGFVVEKKTQNTRNEELQQQENQNKQIIKNKQSELKDYINGYNAYNKSLDTNKTKYKNNLVVYDSVKKVSTTTANNMYKALYSQFNSFLDERDWKHVDLIIFYLETGRGDTLKECLQQVDRQVQVDAIISEIRKASNSICQTINRSINQLRVEMVGCFNNLSNQLNIQHKEIMGKLNDINKGISSINKNINDLNSAIKDGNAIMNEISNNMNNIANANYLQNALLTKISVDSMLLEKDMNYIVNYKVPGYISNQTFPTYKYIQASNYIKK